MKKFITIVVILLFLAGIVYVLKLYPQRPQVASINSFDECAAAGYPIQESHPARCVLPDGRSFVKNIPTTEEPTDTPTVTNVQEVANIVVDNPTASMRVYGKFTLEGKARVFENALSYRLLDANGKILTEDFLTAQAPDIGQFGPFEAEVVFTSTTSTGTLEVFSHSAKDGSEINMVRIPLQFRE